MVQVEFSQNFFSHRISDLVPSTPAVLPSIFLLLSHICKSFLKDSRSGAGGRSGDACFQLYSAELQQKHRHV